MDPDFLVFGSGSGGRQVPESHTERFFGIGVSKPVQQIPDTGKKAIDLIQAVAPESVFDMAVFRRLGALDFAEQVLQMELQRFQVADTRFIQVEGIEIADIDLC